MLDLSSLKKAVTSLERAVRVSTNQVKMAQLDQDQRDTMRAGVIQNFEFTYELCWKMLKRHLELVSPSRETIDQASFRELIRLGAQKGIIDDPERWFEYRRQRNITSHTYDIAKAQSVFETATKFVRDARHLLEMLDKHDSDD